MRSALLAVFVPLIVFSQEDFRLLRSQSGPSGRISGSRFVFDETRTRFVYPQDKSFSVYFEWDAPPGLHALTANWKGPDGRTLSISPEVKIETTGRELNCVWAFEIGPDMPGGVWNAEIRIDGRPAGAHPFELVVPAKSAPEPTAPQKTDVPPSLDELYRKAGSSLVWIHKLDPGGRRVDTALGFVLGSNMVATAFQCIDGATFIEVEFADGARHRAAELHSWHRTQDWAVLSVPTGQTSALERGDPAKVAVGQRLIVFNVEANLARVIGGVDISGRRTLPIYGERLQLSPNPSVEAVGGPLLDERGRVVGIVGGSVTPGFRVDRRQMSVSPGMWSSLSSQIAATPLSAVPEKSNSPTLFTDLITQGALTPPLEAMPEFSYGGSTRLVTKQMDGRAPPDTSEFSRKDASVWIYALMQRKDKRSKGLFSGQIFDPMNRLRGTVAPKKVSLQDAPTRIAFSFPPTTLEAGTYRVDLLWDERPFWRTWITISD